MTKRLSGQTARSYEFPERARRLLFSKDREIRKLSGALSRLRSTFEYVQAVIRDEGRRDPAWTLAQIRGATDSLAEYIGATFQRVHGRLADQFGELDHEGHLIPDYEQHDMWTIAAWLPKGREEEVAEFLAEHGIEVYRMWQPDVIKEHQR